MKKKVKQTKKKAQVKGAMEMSMGTIVTIVLLMSVLVLGLVLVRSIFKVGTNVVDATDDQLKDRMKELFDDQTKVVIYPDTDQIKMKRGDTTGIAIGVRNKITGTDSTTGKFTYEVVVNDQDVKRNCGITETEVEKWIRGRTGTSDLPQGSDTEVQKVLFDIPESAPLCSLKLNVNVKVNGANYDSENFFLTIK